MPQINIENGGLIERLLIGSSSVEYYIGIFVSWSFEYSVFEEV